MTWTPKRHAEHLRTLAMLTRCAGNADGAKDRPGTGNARRTLCVPHRSGRFDHYLTPPALPFWGWLSLEVEHEHCVTYAPARSCSCGAFDLEWR